MKILVDCDVLLDVAVNRQPYAQDSSALLDWAETHPGKCVMAWHSAANMAYLTKGNARAFIGELLGFIEVPSTGGHFLEEALQYPMVDLEDAMQVAAASAAGAQVIATRNVRDFAKSPIRALTPAAILKLLDQRQL